MTDATHDATDAGPAPADEMAETVQVQALTALAQQRRTLDRQVARLREALAHAEADLAAWDSRHLDEMARLRQSVEARERAAAIEANDFALHHPVRLEIPASRPATDTPTQA